MAEKFLLAFIPVFVAIDPIGLVALFMGLGTGASGEHRKRQAFLGILTGLCVSVGFIFLGKIIFTALGITVADFQIAGGLILLGLAGRSCWEQFAQPAAEEFGVVPLRMVIAGPAADRFLILLIRWESSSPCFVVRKSRPCRHCPVQCGAIRAVGGSGASAEFQDHCTLARGDCRWSDPARLADALIRASGALE
jgi:hypothetical protein